MNEKTLAELGKGIADLLRKHVADRLAPLEKRIAELESRPHLKYRGTWESERQYNEADLATDGGSMWYCRRSTRDRPGVSADWQLAVKRGKDAR